MVLKPHPPTSASSASRTIHPAGIKLVALDTYTKDTYKTETTSVKPMTMGRIGDGDVHAAYVEFRAKESDKVRHQLLVLILPLGLLCSYDRPLYLGAHQADLLRVCSLASASQHNASTVNPYGPKTPHVNASTS